LARQGGSLERPGLSLIQVDVGWVELPIFVMIGSGLEVARPNISAGAEIQGNRWSLINLASLRLNLLLGFGRLNIGLGN
jgi:hypothetical protein